MRRPYVASTFIRRHFGTICPRCLSCHELQIIFQETPQEPRSGRDYFSRDATGTSIWEGLFFKRRHRNLDLGGKNTNDSCGNKFIKNLSLECKTTQEKKTAVLFSLLVRGKEMCKQQLIPSSTVRKLLFFSK